MCVCPFTLVLGFSLGCLNWAVGMKLMFSSYYLGCGESSWPIKLYIYMKIRMRVLVAPCFSSSDVLRIRLSSLIDPELAS